MGEQKPVHVVPMFLCKPMGRQCKQLSSSVVHSSAKTKRLYVFNSPPGSATGVVRRCPLECYVKCRSNMNVPAPLTLAVRQHLITVFM